MADLSEREFPMKLQFLFAYYRDARPLRYVLAYFSVMEFQKRGLVHAHIILFLDRPTKFSLQGPLQVDKFISAEIYSN